MRNILFVTRRDLKIFYTSPGAYLLLFFFLAASSIWFYEIDNFLVANRAEFGSYFTVFPYLLIIIIPALAMGSIAGERQSGTLEMLYTLPVTALEIVIGKYAALLVESTLLLVLTVPVPMTLLHLGSFDRGQIISEYIGIFLLSGTFVSVSLLLSSVAAAQVHAYVLSVFVFFLITVPGMVFVLSPLLQYISPVYHYTAFAKGILDTRDISYYLLVSLLSLFLCRERLLLERWK